MRITIIGNYGAGNLGDEAILSGLTQLIKRKHPRAEIFVLGKGKLLPLGVRSFIRALFDWQLWKRPLATLKKSDCVIIGGGGLFSDEESRTATLFWSLHGIIAHSMGKRLLCLGISLGNMGWLSRQFTKMLFKRAEAVVVRDNRSLEDITAWGYKAKIAPDLALAMNIEVDPLYPTNTNKEKYVVINLRRFKNFDEKLIQLFAQLADFLVDEFAFRIVFLPLSTTPNSDHHILNKVFDQMLLRDSAKVEGENDRFDDIVNLIRGAEFVISMRLHGTIFSIIAETSVLPIAYMDKIDNFWSDKQLGIVPLSVKALTFDSLTNHVIEQLNTRERAVRNLQLYKGSVVNEFNAVLSAIA